MYKWENTILPDVYVEQTIEDLREGRDGVMEWVLACVQLRLGLGGGRHGGGPCVGADKGIGLFD